jgi:hypothetical protein
MRPLSHRNRVQASDPKAQGEARRTPSPAVMALVEAAKEWREADDQLRGPFGAAAPQTAMNRLASRTVKLREALAAVEREIGGA